ncbi:LysR family transcriptional regulator [Slackia heliotrinireducens]|uniref:LysR family transcriptional regulator n=1 Tax=Slackia heliotrinireducens TaxID=84110 RepID=UPI0033158B2F
MDIQQLRYFQKAAEKGNFARAADELYVSRATMSKSMSRLEAEVGFPLFERTRDGVRLTSEGERFHENVQAVLDAYQGLEYALGNVPHQRTITVGVPLSYTSIFKPRLRAYEKAHEDVRIIVKSIFDADGQDLLDAGAIDLLVTSFPVHDASDEGLVLLKSPIYIAMRSDCPLAQRDIVTLQDMADYSVVYYLSGFAEFNWAPKVGTVREVFENDIMYVYTRVLNEGMLFPAPYHTLPHESSSITSRPYDGTSNVIETRGYISRRIQDDKQLMNLVSTVRQLLVIEDKELRQKSS